MFCLVDMIIFFLVDFLYFSFVMRDVTIFGTELILEFLDMIWKLLFVMEKLRDQLDVFVQHAFHLLFLLIESTLQFLF